MPRHQQVTCEHCDLSICAVCGAYEKELTTDCPGVKIEFDKQCEIEETSLDYTDARGWHQGSILKPRSPRFRDSPLSPKPPQTDPRAAIAPLIDWSLIDRGAVLQHELTLRAIAWVLADRDCDDQAAALTRTQNETAGGVQVNFQQACRRVEECDEAFRQAARTLVSTLENAK